MTVHSGIYIYITNNVILGYTPIFGSDNPEETNLLVLSFFPSLFEIMVPRSAKNQRCFDATEIPIEMWGTHMKKYQKNRCFLWHGRYKSYPQRRVLKIGWENQVTALDHIFWMDNRSIWDDSHQRAVDCWGQLPST